MKRLAAAVVAAAALAHADAVYFSPRGGCEEALVAAIAAAEESIDVAMYSFTNDRLADALIAAARRGVRVRVLLDGRQCGLYNAQGMRLAAEHVDVRLKWNEKGAFHVKFALIDESQVITGSYNWTYAAEKENEEYLLITDKGPAPAEFKKQFSIWWHDSPTLEFKPANGFKTDFFYTSFKDASWFHLKECPFVKGGVTDSYTVYRNRGEALSEGKKPCPYCCP